MSHGHKRQKAVTKEEAARLGAQIRGDYDNLFVGSFAAEMVGESYPFSKEMVAIVLDPLSDEQLGYKMAAWMAK